MIVFYGVIYVIMGAVVGSFLNVCIDRLPQEQSLLYPPSHCPSCQRRLTPWELIPIVSYLWLRGRCHQCKAAIPRRVFAVELGSAFLFAFLWWWYGLSISLPVVTFYGCLFLVIAIIDLEHGVILDVLVYPALVIALVLAVFLPKPGLASALVGGVVGLVLMLVPLLAYRVLLHRESMGWGDVEMAGLMGVVTGFPLVITAIFIAVVAGGLVGTILLLARLKGRKETIPFGPFLSFGVVLALLWGQPLLDWYLHLLF